MAPDDAGMSQTMTPEQLAATIHGREYGSEVPNETSHAAQSAGLVIVYGASDDLIEFDGAIYDEASVRDGTCVLVDSEGLVSRDNAETDDEIAEYVRRRDNAAVIRCLWDRDGYSWVYETAIPHATFDIMEAGDKYCRGLVFRVADLP